MQYDAPKIESHQDVEALLTWKQGGGGRGGGRNHS